jgi:class 3 adenylate cyclase/tetratricopeptide (TPR) repeat protein
VPQIITLVFTDVVGSSAAKRDTDLGSNPSIRDRAYLEAIQSKHLRLVRSAVAEHKGKEIMTMGDSFFLTFDEPLDALRCCAAIQQRLNEQPIDTLHGPLRLRIGIHVGMPEYFEGSWHGTDVDTAARVQSVASPRQIVVTHATRQLLGEPIGIKFRPLGSFALKGVGHVKLWDADYDYHGLRVPAMRSKEQNKRVTRIKLAVMVLPLLFSATVIGWQVWLEHEKQNAAAVVSAPVSAGAPSSIIVADFENKTGDAVFDATLTQAFIIQLQQSPVITVVSPQHLRQSMKFLGKSPDDPLTPAIAQEIGVREGDKAYVTGTISKIGDAYLITVSAVNTATGDTIASEQAQSADKNHVLDALSTVSTSMRNKLGESLSSIQKLDTPLGQATTASLDAFRAFALGDVAHYAGHEIPDAEGHYKQALELDPNFAVVWARLGTVYANSGQNGKSLDCYTRAFQLDKNASDRERWYIETKYYGYVVGNVQKTIDILELACQTYPLDWGERLNLGVAQGSIGRYEQGLANVQLALKDAPDSAIAHNANLNGLLVLDRYPEAQKVADDWKRLDANSTTYATTVYNLHLLTGDTEAMAQDVASTMGRDDEFQMTSTVAIGEEFQGKYAAADQSWKRAAAQAEAQKAGDAQAALLLNRLAGRAIAGIAGDNTGPEIKAALALDQTKPTLQAALLTAVICSQPGIAQPIMDQLAHDYPEDTINNEIILPSCRACLAFNAHQPQVVLQELQSSEGYDLISGIPFLQGLAYLDLKDGPHAVDCFRRATKYRGAMLLNGLQNYGQAQLGLARAYVMSGDTASAKKAYEVLLNDLWKGADADLPQLVAAKKEYAALK